jgi:hypothetical protein
MPIIRIHTLLHQAMLWRFPDGSAVCVQLPEANDIPTLLQLLPTFRRDSSADHDVAWIRDEATS